MSKDVLQRSFFDMDSFSVEELVAIKKRFPPVCYTTAPSLQMDLNMSFAMIICKNIDAEIEKRLDIPPSLRTIG